MAKKGNFFPLQLSGGELQRVGIARAIVGKPEVLLADEPTGNLDPQSACEVLKLFKEINLTGTTVIVATHNDALVNKFEERVIVLSKGKLVSDNPKSKMNQKKAKCKGSKKTWKLWQKTAIQARRSPYQGLAAMLTTTLTLLVVSVFTLLSFGSIQILEYFESAPQVIAFFKPGEDLPDVPIANIRAN